MKSGGAERGRGFSGCGGIVRACFLAGGGALFFGWGGGVVAAAAKHQRLGHKNIRRANIAVDRKKHDTRKDTSYL
jgi:hypothetical protein